MFAVILLYTKAIKTASKKTAKAGGQVAEVAAEDIGAIVELKSFSLEERAASHFGTTVERQRRFGFKVGRMQAEFTPLVAAMVAFSNALIMCVGAWVAAGRGHSFGVGGLTIPPKSLTIGDLTIFLLYSKLLYQPMRNLSKLASLATNAAAGAERITEVLNQPVENSQPRYAGLAPQWLAGGIAYRGVVFGYDERRPVLTGIDIDIAAGRRVALVGLSGSGKTTLVKLLPRFYDVWTGSIAIDGVDVRDIPLEQLRASISMVLQDSVPSREPSARTSPWGAPRPATRRSSTPPARRTSTTPSPACRTATTPTCASRARTSPGGSASAWRSPARSSTTRPSSSSTSPPPTSTSRRRAR
jgi:ABC-type multidrug transport system fused ATPase/permease subunit